MDALTTRPARTSEPGVAALINAHFELMRASSPEESCHVMSADSLDRDGAFLIAAEKDGAILGIGALNRIGDGHGELKSMHTLCASRGQGVARTVLNALIDVARDKNITRLSLETGSMDMFAPARALYASEGFSECAPFGNYVADPLSTFMTREL